MARYHSFIKFEGTMGGLTFAEGPHGDGIVKAKNRSYQPTAEGTWRNARLFGGGASTLCKHFRRSFMRVASQFTHQDTCGRLNARFRTAMDLSSQRLGRQGFDLLLCPEALAGFPFHSQLSVLEVLSARLLEPLDLHAIREHVRWMVPEFTRSDLKSVPDGATHFQLVLVATQVSPAAPDAEGTSYVQTLPVDANSAGICYSALYALDAPTYEAVSLEVVPGRHLPTPDAMAVVVCAGILYGRMVKDKFLPNKKGSALDVMGVG
ncbi:MAG: hypothetical protein R2797_02850 [Gelidibacter sp.]